MSLDAATLAGTPRAAGFAMPAEWTPHERTLMAWPVRRDLWNESLAQARDDYAAVARAIAAFEPVLMVAPEGARAEVADRCGSGVEVVELPIDDSWLRDNGPIGVVDADGRRAGVDFVFNAWGEKFAPWDRDAALAEALLEHLGIDRFDAPLVLEGGSISVDGEGTLITTEQCLLHPTRNPRPRARGDRAARCTSTSASTWSSGCRTGCSRTTTPTATSTTSRRSCGPVSSWPRRSRTPRTPTTS